MEFLPIRLDGEPVYAGFWKRLCAGVVDLIIIMPLNFFFTWLGGFDRMLAIGIAVPSSAMFAMYNVWFNAQFGGTPGKMAVGIRIAKPNGTRIGWSEAWKRSAVDLVPQVTIVSPPSPEFYYFLGILPSFPSRLPGGWSLWRW